VAGCGFIRSSAYGDVIRTQGSDAPFVSLGTVPESVVGQDVLLVEDILDQGVTLHALVSRIRESGVRSLKLCVLLDKQLETPSDQVLRLRADLALDYVGFRVPDRWLAGYGLDAAGEYRDLPCIAVLREEFFTNPSPP
jgi:hypoxanthine phosphoribosyltransferase